MKILLVDDSLAHRKAGKKQLTECGHEVVATSEYTEALRLVGQGDFTVALLDLLMPAEAFMLGQPARIEHLGREIGIGFPLILAMAGKVQHIAVATEMNHHNHPMSAAVDWFRERVMVIDGTKVRVMHAPMKDGVKDWAEVLRLVLGH